MTQPMPPRTFQDLIFALQRYWSDQGCVILQPYDMEMGAGTFHTATFLRAVGPEPWSAAYVQPSRRPTDGRYGENPFRLQHYYQFQVAIKPSPDDFQELYWDRSRALGFDPLVHDIRFVEDNWESPTSGAWGLGWEVWLNGMEVSQFTYFQQVGGLDCRPVMGEITYGLERLAMYIQGKESIFDIVWTDGPFGTVTYGDVFHQNEVEQSTYNFEKADTAVLLREFDTHEAACRKLLDDQAGVARLRADGQGIARLQSPRRAAGGLGDRAAALHPARAHLGARRRRGLLAQPRSARLPAAQGRGARGDEPMSGRDLLFELQHGGAAAAHAREPVEGAHRGPRQRVGYGRRCARTCSRFRHAAASGRARVAAAPRQRPIARSSGAGRPSSNAFDASGAPTQAALAFARNCGVRCGAARAPDHREGRVAGLPRPRARHGDRSAAARLDRAGDRGAADCAAHALGRAAAREFVRPVHGVVLLLRRGCGSGDGAGTRNGAHDARPPIPCAEAHRAQIARSLRDAAARARR